MAYKKLPKRPKIYPYKGNRLMWPKQLYKEWYLYCKLAGDEVPKDFRVIGTFDEWMRPDLFAEPALDDAVVVKSEKGHKLVLELDLRHTFHTLSYNWLKTITDRKEKLNFDNASNAKCQPNVSIHDAMKVTTLDKPRKAYMLRQKGLSNIQIAYKLDLLKNSKHTSKEIYEYHVAKTKKDSYGKAKLQKKVTQHVADIYERRITNASSLVSRHIAKCEELLDKVANGIFP